MLYVIGGFDGMKRNDLYRIVVDNSYQARLLSEMESGRELEIAKEEEEKN